MSSPDPARSEPSAAHPFAAAHAGIVLREGNREGEAEDVFLRLIRDHPDTVYGWQELAILYARRAKPAKALYLFRRAVNAAPHDLQPRIHCALHLLGLGRVVEADQVLAAHRPASPDDARRLRSIREFLVYLREWPITRALALTHEFEHGPHALDLSSVKALLLDAVRSRRAFSLIRLGDGEGAWIGLGESDEADYAALHAENRLAILRTWFGGGGLLDDPAFGDVVVRLKRAVSEADLLGIPLTSRIEGEYALRSPRGYGCNLDLLRWLRRTNVAARRFCSQDIHLKLQFDGFYPELFRAASEVGLITCHRQLAAHVTERTGASVLAVHLIPEEKGFSHILGHNGVDGPHFPEVFARVMADLERRSLEGTVWVVAAGVLGKLYCGAIKRRGGCAIDLGSIVDGWLGKLTRPTLEDDPEFLL